MQKDGLRNKVHEKGRIEKISTDREEINWVQHYKISVILYVAVIIRAKYITVRLQYSSHIVSYHIIILY